uniref:Uncharacterized protein LOC111128595 n=1 Tax=Crassostrea virginica TaxID=6565 RepID=A0A8B8DQS3_CRAVI|nr:uncharacterized protein LOC111128595 [Crassostrea virginica]
MTALREIQSSYEQRFNCMICLCPRLEMVSGYCQHRICTQCLYNEDNIRKPSLDKCPTCQKEEAFPVIRPAIPEDVIEIQRCLGVRSCPHTGCSMEFWEWEMEEHLKSCPNRQPSPPKPALRKGDRWFPERTILPKQHASLAVVHLIRVLRPEVALVSRRVTLRRSTQQQMLDTH